MKQLLLSPAKLVMVWLLAAAITAMSSTTVYAQMDLKIRDLCRLKGQETNTLQGLGLVVGLKGTGDGESSKPMMRMLAQAMMNMGGAVGMDAQGRLIEKEMANAKNAAVVMIEAVVPASGAEQGDLLNCTVNALNAKSLEGGTLMLSALWGPRADQPTIYGLARGQIVIDDRKVPTTGKIANGVKIESPIRNEFVAGNKITLLLDQSHASFTTAQAIEDAINNLYEAGLRSNSSTTGGRYEQGKLAKAIDQSHVEVRIPPTYQDQPVNFASLILNMEVLNVQGSRRVVIQRDNSIIIGEDVFIAPVAIQHANLNISPRVGKDGPFIGLSARDGSQLRPPLKNLVDALNTLNVPAADIVSIIKGLKRQGNLYGELIIE